VVVVVVVVVVVAAAAAKGYLLKDRTLSRRNHFEARQI
jgi:hypothetical protein